MQKEKCCLYGAEFPEEQRRNEDILQTGDTRRFLSATHRPSV